MSVHVSGPFFNGEDQRLIRAMSDEIARAVTDRGYELVMTEFPRVLQHPTGRLQSHVHTEFSGHYGKIVSDGVVYNHWIEGTGSRNRTTRFKGYFVFRRMTEILRATCVPVAQAVADRYIGRM